MVAAGRQLTHGVGQESLFAVKDHKHAAVRWRLTPCSRSFCVPSGLSRRRGGAAEEEHPVGDRGGAGDRVPAGTSATLFHKVKCVQQMLTTAAALSAPLAPLTSSGAHVCFSSRGRQDFVMPWQHNGSSHASQPPVLEANVY